MTEEGAYLTLSLISDWLWAIKWQTGFRIFWDEHTKVRHWSIAASSSYYSSDCWCSVIIINIVFMYVQTISRKKERAEKQLKMCILDAFHCEKKFSVCWNKDTQYVTKSSIFENSQQCFNKCWSFQLNFGKFKHLMSLASIILHDASYTHKGLLTWKFSLKKWHQKN